MKYAASLALAILLLSGCIQQAQVQVGPLCDKPYILVGADCCLDENSDGICDRDKPICAKPYILIAKECCLDADQNSICDRDEIQTTQTSTSLVATPTSVTRTTSMGPAISSTTLVQTGSTCTSFSDCPIRDDVKCDNDGREMHVQYTPISCRDGGCIYRSSVESSVYPCDDWEKCLDGLGCVKRSDAPLQDVTSPTIPLDFKIIMDRIADRAQEVSQAMKTTTTTLMAPCVDPDGGRKYDLKSVNVSGYFQHNQTYGLGLSEFCIGPEKLREYYCESNVLRYQTYDCGIMCDDGRCCVGEGNICTSSRDCCSGRCGMIGMTNHCI